MGSLTKITDDGVASCSLIPRIFSEDNKTLDNCIRARKGENVRTPGNRITEIGNVLEEPLIIHGAKLLGLEDLESDVTTRYEHKTLPLQASLDARAKANNLLIEENSEWGIYTPGASKVLLDGWGVIENKVTRDYPGHELEEWRGLLQMQGQMEVMDYNWGAVFVLYTSTDFRLYVYKRDPSFAAILKEKIKDFERRIQEEDYWPAKVVEDLHLIHKGVSDDVKELDNKVDEDVKEFEATTKIIKDMEAAREELNLLIMSEMGNHTKAETENYILSAPTITRKPTARKVVDAKPGATYKAKTIRIKSK